MGELLKDYEPFKYLRQVDIQNLNEMDAGCVMAVSATNVEDKLNLPEEGLKGIVTCVGRPNNGYAQQTFMCYDKRVIYFRSRIFGSWTPWTAN